MCAWTLSILTVADVTKIAHRERVPIGSLPKMGKVLTPLWEDNTNDQEEKISLEMCILVPSTVTSSYKPVAAVKCFCLTDASTAKDYWPSKIYTHDIFVHWYYWTILLIKITSFTGYKSFLKALCVHWHIYCFHHRVLGHKYMELFAGCYVIPVVILWNNDYHLYPSQMLQYMDNVIINVHLLRQLLPSTSTTSTSTSIYIYIGYHSSAVGLDNIALRAMLVLL